MRRASRCGEAQAADEDEFLIGFGPVAGHVTLSAAGDLAEAAARLYACLHAGAAAAQPRIAVALSQTATSARRSTTACVAPPPDRNLLSAWREGRQASLRARSPDR
jgi:hypothetical protein